MIQKLFFISLYLCHRCASFGLRVDPVSQFPYDHPLASHTSSAPVFQKLVIGNHVSYQGGNGRGITAVGQMISR